MAEQRYQAVLAVISDGLSVSQVAEKVGVSRQTLHTWLARYAATYETNGAFAPANDPITNPERQGSTDTETSRIKRLWTAGTGSRWPARRCPAPATGGAA